MPMTVSGIEEEKALVMKFNQYYLDCRRTRRT